MKIRMGHVSNSSSSSFVGIGKELTLEEVLNYDGDKKITVVGEYLYQGQDVFNLTPEMIEAIKQSNNKEGLQYASFYTFDGNIGEYVRLNKEDLPDGELVLVGGDWDDWTTSTIEEFKRRYIHED